MRLRFFSILTIFISVIVISCQKELEPYNLSTTDSAHTGTDTTIDDTTDVVSSFQPLSIGSWWKYQDSATAVISQNTIASPTKVINGITYKALVSTSDVQTDTLWTAAPAPNYYLAAQGLSPSGVPYDLLFYYLNDTASVGYSLKYTAGTGNGFTAYITTTIIAKNLTLTVAGKTYTNVTQTQLDLAYDILGTVSDYGNYNYFIAQGTGIIKIRSQILLSGIPVLQTCSDLIDYSIK